jgi:ATP-dependent 26S proteasome regulatory subunit
MRAHGRSETIDAGTVAALTPGFSGAEVAALVPDAMFSAFADGERAIATPDLANAAGKTVPLSKTAGERLDALRRWATNRARPASTQGPAAQASEARNIDL